MEHSTNNRERILAIAGNLFAQKGLDQTSLSDIAAGAGLSKGTLYYYYRSKDDLIYDIMVHNFQRLTDSLIESLRFLGPGSSPAALIQLTLEKVLREEELIRLTFYLMINAITGNEDLRLKVRQKYRDSRQIVRSEIVALSSRGPDDPRLEALASTVLSVLDGISLQYLIAPDDVDIAAVAREFGRMFEAGRE